MWQAAVIALRLQLDRSGDDEFLDRINDLFALGLVVVGLANEGGGRADVFEYVTVISEKTFTIV